MSICLVLGGGDTLHADLDAYTGPIDGVVTANDAVAEWPGGVDAAVSLHPGYFLSKGWLRKREERGYAPPKRLIGHEEWKRGGAPEGLELTEYRFPGVEKSGSSGLFAAKVALIDLGFERVVFCGVPLTVTPHFFGGDPWKFAENYRRVWLTLPDEYRNRMRSMSGWTRVYLGAPETVKEKRHD